MQVILNPLKTIRAFLLKIHHHLNKQLSNQSLQEHNLADIHHHTHPKKFAKFMKEQFKDLRKENADHPRKTGEQMFLCRQIKGT
jgi:hypothetical protein